MSDTETATSVRLRLAESEITALKLERDELKAMVRLLMAKIGAMSGPEPCGDCDPCLGGRPDQCAIFPTAVNQHEI